MQALSSLVPGSRTPRDPGHPTVGELQTKEIVTTRGDPGYPPDSKGVAGHDYSFEDGRPKTRTSFIVPSKPTK